ncbi:hypothetical protein ACIP9C_14175 [Lysinibacillus sp. NPDC093210]|uniref:hypothetical protein n=1 Tax=Lysinibacillus sp. NPDC093210 TaxID=3364133 RepID=UPI003800E23E
MEKNIGKISYLLILVLFLLFMELSHSIANKDETEDNNITWHLNNIVTFASTEEFVISDYVNELKLNKIKQSTASESKRVEAKIEYRLLKLDSKGTFIDTGIYNVLEGSKGKNKADGNLYGSISPGTYKIKITNLNGEDLQVHTERILVINN